MLQEYQWRLREADDEAANRQAASLGGLAISLLLLVVGLLLVRELHTRTAIEDCLSAGHSVEKRANIGVCLPIASATADAYGCMMVPDPHGSTEYKVVAR